MHGLLLWVPGCEPHPKQQTAAAGVHYGDDSDDKCDGWSYGHVRLGARGHRRSNGWVRLAPGSVLSTEKCSGASFTGCSSSGDMAGVEKLSGTTARGREGQQGKGESG